MYELMPTKNENIGLNDAIDALESLNNYRNWILDEFGPYLNGRTVEIGAGSGSLSEKLLQFVPELDLIELSPELSQRLKSRLGNRENVTLHNSSAEDWLAEAEPSSRETIVMVNVLEHIEDDVASLKQIFNTLTPGGALLIFVPALNFLFSRLDHEHGHFRRYGKNELKLKTEQAGFDILQIKYMDLLGIAPWLVMNKWLEKTEFDEGLVRLYDTIGIPTTRFLESILRSPLGKNVLLIAKKPE
jgi:SAM-dependent methyltransferase